MNTESTPLLASSAPFKPPSLSPSLVSQIRTYIRTQLAIHNSNEKKIHDEEGEKLLDAIARAMQVHPIII